MIRENIKIDDSSLLSKKVITAKDVFNLLPKEVCEHVADIRVLVDDGKVLWRIILDNEIYAGYHYVPHSGVLIYEAYACRKPYGRIFIGRRARFSRTQFSDKGNTHDIYSVYFCCSRVMVLLGDVDEIQIDDGENGIWSATCRYYFRHYKN